jgi:hypothetical protein
MSAFNLDCIGYSINLLYISRPDGLASAKEQEQCDSCRLPHDGLVYRTTTAVNLDN